MSYASLPIPFEATERAADPPDLRVRLEAEGGGNRPTLTDIDQMLARAAVGMSARTVLAEGCAAAKFGKDGTVIVTLAVLVWPSRADLRYTLDLPPEVTPGAVEVIREERAHKAWAAGGGVIELPWRMERAAPAWAYGCWDERSRSIPGPPLRHDQARVIIEGERAGDAHGIVVARGVAVGFRHELVLGIGKVDADTGAVSSIDIESVPVSAVWTNADGEDETAEIDIPIPECAKDLLAECPDGTGEFFGRVRDAKDDVYEVAYNACDGRMLAYRKVEAEDE